MTGLPDIRDDVAFVSGAASGIGYALTKELAARGARVIITDIQESACQTLASELNTEAGKTVAIAAKVDTTSWDEQVAAYELGKQTFGRVDYFFANAGIVEAMWIPKFEADQFDPAAPIEKPNLKTAEINYLGQINTAALALQVFQRQSFNRHGFRGKLVLTSSIYGFFHSVTMPMYCSSKSGILAFMRSTSDFYKDKNITVNCICPNATPTNIAPPDFFIPFREQDVLTPLDFVIEQYIVSILPDLPKRLAERVLTCVYIYFQSLLGTSQDNGKAIGVYKKDAWDHPLDTYRREENRASYGLIDDGIAKAFGYWA
ncbi:NAD-P-binding protein [Marasmius fiardii PR-910]|nr:NAD-P-binding protein [Marasmius fiardii PR-910]